MSSKNQRTLETDLEAVIGFILPVIILFQWIWKFGWFIGAAIAFIKAYTIYQTPPYHGSNSPLALGLLIVAAICLIAGLYLVVEPEYHEQELADHKDNSSSWFDRHELA